MATAAVQQPSSALKFAPINSTTTSDRKVEKQDVQTVLNFFKDNEDGSPPAPAYVNQPQTYERPTASFPVTVHDITGNESDYTLDSHGFQIVPSVSVEKDFLDEEQIKDRYYKETEQLLKDVTGATRVFIFDHTIRREPKDTRNTSTPQSRASLRGPVHRVHIDQSSTAALSRVPHHLPDIADKLLKGRVQLINVWRPIKTVKRDPLGIAASHTVDDNDLVPIGLIYPNRKGETLAVRYNEKQQWYYKAGQTPQEALLIKCFDNWGGEGGKEGVRAKRVPHTAFEIPGRENEENRESIEVRALVFTEVDE